MKIVICGAGIVGSAIARHLATEQNDVTVVDSDPEKIQWITEHADVGAVEGVASHPNILARAGLADSDLLIAVTESDEDYFSYEYGLNRNESVGAGNRKRAASKRDKTLGRIKTISGPEDL